MTPRRFRFLSLYAGLFIAFLYAPTLLLPLFSLNDGVFAIFPLEGFTFRHYAKLAGNAGMLEALYNSLGVATFAAFATTGLALPLSIALTRRKLPASDLLLSTVMLPLVVPTIIFAVAFLIIIVRVFGMELSLGAIAVAHVFVCLPFSVVVLMSSLEGLDLSLEEASRDLGETSFGTFRRVTLPLIMPAVVSSLLLCFISSFDEFVLAFFLSGTSPTLPVYLYGQLRFPNNLPSLLALGTVILVVSSAVVVLAEVIRQRWEARLKALQAP
jgi:spermidine/putrescine transport system permease protein